MSGVAPYTMARPAGSMPYCSHGRIRMATVPSGCPKVVEVLVENAGAIAGDYVQLALSLPGSCNNLQACGNEINNGGMASCNPFTYFKSSVQDPPVWEPGCFAQHFVKTLLASPKLNNLLSISFDDTTNTIRFEGNHPAVCFEIEDQSQGFANTITEVVPGEPSAEIPYGSAVCIDACGFVHLLGANPDCTNFAGFAAKCQDLYEECGAEITPATGYRSGLSIPVLEAKSSIVVNPAIMPSSETDIPVFDPAAPFGAVSFVPYGSPPPAGGFALDGWSIESIVSDPLEIVLTHC